MPSYPNDRSNNPLFPIEYGRDYNFFNKITVVATTFNTACDVLITFPTQTVTLFLEGTGAQRIEYSFNGNTVHGDMTIGQASASLTFENRVISKIWFQAVSGEPVVRIEAWGTR